MEAAVDFSEKAVFTGPLPCFSPDGKLVALAQEYRLVVREVETLAVVGLFSCLDRIEALSWSPCGDLILCGMYTHGTAQVFSIADSEWSCSITEGLAGICSARWCPSCEEILLTAEFQVKLSVWSLVDQNCHNLPPPKHPEAGIAFSPDGTQLAVLERLEFKDWLAVYDTSCWELISHSPLATTDAADISWSPDGTCVACWDSPAQGPLLCIVDPAGSDTNAPLAILHGTGYGLGFKSVAWSPSGQLLVVGSYEQEASVLNNVTWTALAGFQHATAITGPASVLVYQEEIENPKPSGTGVGEDLQQLRQQQRENNNINGIQKRREQSNKILPSPNKPGFGSSSVSRPDNLPRLAIPAVGGPSGPSSSRAGSPSKSPLNSARSHNGNRPSPRKPPLSAWGAGSQRSLVATLAGQLDNPASLLGDNPDNSTSQYSISDLPLKLPAVRAAVDRPNPKAGVGISTWSPDGAYLATRCDDRPNIMWIWDSAKLELASVLIQAAPIRAAEWSPSLPHRLALACASGRVYFWTPNGASCAHVPVQGMKVTSLKWGADGSALMVAGRDTFVCAHLTLEAGGYMGSIAA
jgi:WD40 repeat protein